MCDGCRMNRKLGLVGLLLLACGAVIISMSYLNLYHNETEVFSSGALVPINSYSTNDNVFFLGIGEDLKQVEVIVANGPWGYNSLWGNCWWITHSFQISLLGPDKQIGATINGSPDGGVTYVFDVPSGWTSLNGVGISNPESTPVVVSVTVVLHRQVTNTVMHQTFYLGILLCAVGGIIGAVSIYARRSKLASDSRQVRI